MLKRLLLVLMSLSIILVVVYMLGPKVDVPDLNGTYPTIPTRMADLEAYVSQKEDSVKFLKSDNEAKIVWFDSLNKSKTPYAIVYIHGFGASEKEGDPVHRQLAAYFGANLYLSRLPEHGLERPDSFRFLSSQRLAEAAREAYMIGKSLGDSVIIIGTSMGGALATLVASERPDAKAVILYSPAIRDRNDQLRQLFAPWGLDLFKFSIKNEDKVIFEKREGEKAKYWSEYYHVNAYVSLGTLLKAVMKPATYQKIHQPYFLGYYYADETNQDDVVSVPAMLEMYEEVQTPENLKVKIAYPESKNHVIASRITSEDWESVCEDTKNFLENIAGVSPKRNKVQMDVNMMD
ncbi:alpha/beta hydrolase [Pararhodonellum marinum]|uniref:alpha/beta hydrolase n=1 Tax=Pararhodonellum marinum TaxID=2755358 RepID=UPI00188F0E9F|nr:alpha/beta hydrolase [Pararhodonellum marinum]